MTRGRVVACVWWIGLVGCAGTETASPPSPIAITTPSSLPSAQVGAGYQQTFSATGASGSVDWSVTSGTLPMGLTLSSAGELSGTPGAAENATFTVRAASGGRSATGSFTLLVLPAPLTILTTTLEAATLGLGYSRVLTAAGGTVTPAWSLTGGAMPPGITLTASGIIAGNPTALGPYAFTVMARSGVDSALQALTLQVNPPPLAITTADLPLAKVGQRYTVPLESSGGIAERQWVLGGGSLPTGVTLSLAGILDGTPTAPESTTFVVELTSGTQRVQRTLSLWVDPAGFPSQALVQMPGNVFLPFIVQIQRGGTVTWRFAAEPHNVIFQSAAGVPPDINIVSNVDVSRQFTTLGVFRYDCTIHPGMSGRVEVK